MSIKAVVAKILIDELQSIGIRSLTDAEAELVANRIFERITDLELELAARELIPRKPPRGTLKNATRGVLNEGAGNVRWFTS